MLTVCVRWAFTSNPKAHRKRNSKSPHSITIKNCDVIRVLSPIEHTLIAAAQQPKVLHFSPFLMRIFISHSLLQPQQWFFLPEFYQIHHRFYSFSRVFLFLFLKQEKDVSQEVRAPQTWFTGISPKEACCSSQRKRFVFGYCDLIIKHALYIPDYDFV